MPWELEFGGWELTKATFRIWRGNAEQGGFEDYPTEVSEGMVVLDAVHRIQAEQAGDLAVRWNCKAGKCGSCSAEINGKPRLMCMTRLDTLDLWQAGHGRADEGVPADQGPRHRRLVELRVKQGIKPFKPRKPDAADGTWRMQQREVDRVQEFRKCIECYLCQDVCHILRDHHLHDEFIGPRFLLYNAALEMHPLDTEDRLAGSRTRRHRLLQHHALLHQGVPGAHHHHGECDYSAQGTGGGSVLRSDDEAVPGVQVGSGFRSGSGRFRFGLEVRRFDVELREPEREPVNLDRSAPCSI